MRDVISGASCSCPLRSGRILKKDSNSINPFEFVKDAEQDGRAISGAISAWGDLHINSEARTLKHLPCVQAILAHRVFVNVENGTVCIVFHASLRISQGTGKAFALPVSDRLGTANVTPPKGKQLIFSRYQRENNKNVRKAKEQSAFIRTQNECQTKPNAPPTHGRVRLLL